MSVTRSTCPYCGVGCGVLVDAKGGVTGDPDHPANQGRLCSKGTALGETLDQPGRLLHPEVDGKRASWDAALDAAAEGFRRALAEGGPDSTALYVSGQLLTEDYFAANKFAKAVLGTANIDSNSRLCMASAVAGHKRAFGEDLVPGVYEDLEQADLVVLVGSNLAWCHPVLFQRLVAARAARPSMRVVVIDPRRTASCDAADLHLAVAPGDDVALFDALLCHLHAAGLTQPAPGLDAALAAAAGARPQGIPAADLARFFAWFAATPRVVTLFSQGTNQSSAGTDKANAIINCHVATGRLGQPGAGPFSVTGQPNAMGGREVGALANMLAGHLDWSVPGEHAALAGFWRAPKLATQPGLKAVELFQAAGAGRIGALWVMATNPAVSMPDASAVRAALRRVPMLVVSDCTRDSDTVALARIRLPALGWGEKDGTVTNSERVISRQRGFRPWPGEARPDWWAISQVARRLGWDFGWDGPAAIFREHAAVTTLARPSQRVFDLAGFTALEDAGYAALAPTRWPVPVPGAQGGRLQPAARCVPTPPRPPVNATSDSFPLRLLTGRLRDQWHTMTRTGLVPRLMAHVPEPLLSMHPDDAGAMVDGALARVESDWGSAVLRLKLDTAIPPGSVFAPMHWTDRFAPAARINPAVNPAVDPISGQPELKHTPVRVLPVPMAWHGFVLARQSLPAELGEWAARLPLAHGVWRHELAGEDAPAAAFARLRAAVTEPDAAWVTLDDAAAGTHRAALLRDGRLLAVVFLGASPTLPARDWLAGLFAENRISLPARRALLAGRPADGPAPTPTICVCHGVSAGSIAAAIAGGVCTLAQVGEATAAGTGCGSCRPEINALLAAAKVVEPA